MEPHRIIVSTTTYPGRVWTMHRVIKSILNGLLVPDKIVINLSYKNFKNGIESLPIELKNLANNDIVDFYFIENDNMAFKKLIPTLYRYPDAIISTIDDDIIYPKEYLKSVIDEYMKNGRNYPMNFQKCKCAWPNIETSHGGATTVTEAIFYGNKLIELYNDVALKFLTEKSTAFMYMFDDPLYTYAALLNGVKYVHSKDYIFDYRNNMIREYIDEGISRTSMGNLHTIYRELIEKKYGYTYNKLCTDKTQSELYSDTCERYYNFFETKFEPIMYENIEYAKLNSTRSNKQESSDRDRRL